MSRGNPRPPLPSWMSWAALDELRAAPVRWIDVATDIARSHRIEGALAPFAQGTNLVAAVGDARILKIYPPMLRHQFEAERASLARLEGALSIPTPAIEHVGERDGWPYLVMTRLRGAGGDAVWPTLDEPAREQLLESIGALIAEVQAIAPGPLLALEPRWATFLPRQIAGCRERHGRLALPAHLLEELDGWLHETVALLPRAPREVILTGEYIPENFLVERTGAGWRLSGLIDFGDAMTGPAEYDLIGPSVFMACGEPRRVASLLRGFGATEADPSRSRRLLALLLLHRFADLRAQVRRAGWESARDLDALAALLWPS